MFKSIMGLKKSGSFATLMSTRDVDLQRQQVKSLLDKFIEENASKRSTVEATPASGSSGSTRIEIEEKKSRLRERVEMFLIRLATCYQLYGCPTHIIEITMPRVASGLGSDADFAIFPTYSLVTFIHKNGDIVQRNTQYFRSGGGYDMYKLQMVDELARRVASYAEPNAPVGTFVDKDIKELADLTNRSEVAVVISPETSRKESTVTEKVALTALSPPGSPLDNNPYANRFEMDLEAQLVSPATNINERDLKTLILKMASLGPGFFHNSRHRHDSKYDNLRVHKKQDRYRAFTKIALEDAFESLKQINETQGLYPCWSRWFLTSFAAAGCCGFFFGGGWYDILWSAAIGFCVALLAEGCRNPAFGRLYEFVAAFMVSLLANLIHIFIQKLCFTSVTLSSVIWLVQGATLSIAIIEIMDRKMITGTVRVFYGVVMSALLGFGLHLPTKLFSQALGVSYEDFVESHKCPAGRAIDTRWYPLFFIITATSFNLLVNAHYKQLFPMLTVGGLGILVYYFAEKALGANIASILASFTVGLAANLYNRLTGHPGIICIMAGLFLLVPGSVAIRGFASFFDEDITAGIGLVMTVLMTALSLSIGLFMSTLISKETYIWFDKLDSVLKHSHEENLVSANSFSELNF